MDEEEKESVGLEGDRQRERSVPLRQEAMNPGDIQPVKDGPTVPVYISAVGDTLPSDMFLVEAPDGR